jgi:hypothetical protein
MIVAGGSRPSVRQFSILSGLLHAAIRELRRVRPDRQSFATVCVKVFEQGYNLRHGLSIHPGFLPFTTKTRHSLFPDRKSPTAQLP